MLSRPPILSVEQPLGCPALSPANATCVGGGSGLLNPALQFVQRLHADAPFTRRVNPGGKGLNLCGSAGLGLLGQGVGFGALDVGQAFHRALAEQASLVVASRAPPGAVVLDAGLAQLIRQCLLGRGGSGCGGWRGAAVARHGAMASEGQSCGQGGNRPMTHPRPLRCRIDLIADVRASLHCCDSKSKKNLGH